MVHDRAAPRSNTILVVEDDPAARELLVNHLEGEGWKVAEASSGHEGLRLAKELQPCAILLDVIMPELDGWAVLKILKNDAELSRIPVVLCTIVDDKHQGFALGAADYLTKPVSREDLVSTLSRYCLNPPCDLLLVEDDTPTRELYSRAARRLGWRVMEAADGAQALQCIAEKVPDLILLDLMMPELDGFGVIEALQRESRWRDIPVVVATAKELTAGDRERLNGYVEAVVSKNTQNIDELIDYVVEALARVAGNGG
jgi:CheY-like chemotaxis protein